MPASRKQSVGFSMIEVMVAITLLMIMIVPAMNALSEGVLAARIHGEQASSARDLQNKMESILARSFTKMDLEAFGSNSSDAARITFPLAPACSPLPPKMDDTSYTDCYYDVYIFRCSKNALTNTLTLDNKSVNLLCIQIKQKGGSAVLLQSAKSN
jgi:type II secretory pathway pseudopilin PulG